MANSFITCIYEQMERKGFGKKRADEVVRRFEGLTKAYKAQGTADPELHAMTQAFDELHFDIAERSRRAMNTVAKYAEFKDRFANPLSRNRAVFRKTNEALDPGRQAMSVLDHDQGTGGLAYELDRRSARGQLWSILSDVLNHVSKGAFGIEKGKAHLNNVIRELYGVKTNDPAAADIARAWRKTSNAAVDLFNQAGGSMRKLADWHIPQRQSSAKLSAIGLERWRADHKRWLDWSKMHMPDGSPITPDQYDSVLEYVFRTLRSGGVNKLEPAKIKGQGTAIGNALSQHRFLVYKDADAWLEMHSAYGEGSVFDVMTGYVESMAHEIGLLRTFGSNPRQMAATVKAMARKAAEEMDAREMGPRTGRTWLSRTDANLVKFDKMLQRVMHENPMNPDNTAANLVTSVGNILSSAQLGSAALLAIPGDFMTTAAVRALNGMGFNAPVAHYLSAMTDATFTKKIAAQYGFIFDEMVSSHYAATRFSGFNTYGPALSRRIADITIRASGLSGHTSRIRWANQAEFMGLLARSRNQSFDQLPFQDVLRRYGIDAAAWDAFRAMPPQQPKAGVEFMVPLDLLKSNLGNKDELFRRFQGMLFQESRNMVPEGSIESAMALRDTTRPDTVPGALLYSFAMYKSFPISVMNIYGRLAMSSSKGRLGRIGFMAGLGASMMMAGALGTQLRELANGRDPMPMDTRRFMLKSMLASGGMGIWGDFVFNGVDWVTGYGQGPEDVAAGPIVGVAGDAIDLAWTAATEGGAWILGAENMMKGDWKTDDKMVQFARRQLPGSSLWWSKLIMQRVAWDRLAETADPKAYKKNKAREKRQRETYGNESWWSEGDRIPDRAPRFGGVLEGELFGGKRLK